MSPRALGIAALIGTVLQVAMVVAGHSSPAIKNFYALGGMGFSLVAGLIYGFVAGAGTTSVLAVGGAVAGGICAFIGILVSFLLGDVPATLLALGTISSIVTGAIGGVIARLLVRE